MRVRASERITRWTGHHPRFRHLRHSNFPNRSVFYVRTNERELDSDDPRAAAAKQMTVIMSRQLMELIIREMELGEHSASDERFDAREMLIKLVRTCNLGRARRSPSIHFLHLKISIAICDRTNRFVSPLLFASFFCRRHARFRRCQLNEERKKSSETYQLECAKQLSTQSTENAFAIALYAFCSGPLCSSFVTIERRH